MEFMLSPKRCSQLRLRSNIRRENILMLATWSRSPIHTVDWPRDTVSHRCLCGGVGKNYGLLFLSAGYVALLAALLWDGWIY